MGYSTEDYEVDAVWVECVSGLAGCAACLSEVVLLRGDLVASGERDREVISRWGRGHGEGIRDGSIGG